MKFKLVPIFLLLLLIIPMNISADESVYQLIDYGSLDKTVIKEYSSYYSAYRAYRQSVDTYENLAIVLNEEVIMMEYGIVEFKTNQGCTFAINYEDLDSGQNASINGCYAIDGAYLATVQNGDYVNFKIADTYGQTNRENVILHPFEALNVRLSAYVVIDDILYHEVKTQLNQDFYSNSIAIGKAPEFLEENRNYYSYDGHYFYQDFKLMIDDYLNERYDAAVNANAPYYNYYQYLPHRSLSNYQVNDIEQYFYENLRFDRKLQDYFDLNLDNANDAVNESQYYGELASFFEYQNLYGSNALMMLSISINESAYGKALSAYENNNLFGHAAFDTEIERNSSRYSTLENSVASHAKYYISSRYANHLSSVYNGSFFGNKGSGMNVHYSSDPYWGEKAAANYRILDEALGLKDQESYALGIVEDVERLAIYEDSELSQVKYYLNGLRNYSFIILESSDQYYKIQLDTASDNKEYTYDFETTFAYIAKDEVNHLLNSDKIAQKTYFSLSFDANGGKIAGQESLDLKLAEGQMPAINSVYREGYECLGFEPQLGVATSDTEYVAQYQKIASIELLDGLKEIVEAGMPYNLSGGKLKVNYDDGTSQIKDIDSNMLVSYDTTASGKTTIKINYCGILIEHEIEVSQDLAALRKTLQEKIASNIQSYLQDGTYNIDDLAMIKSGLAQLNYPLSFDEIRFIDQMLLVDSDSNYHILDNKYDLSISGFALSLPNATSDNPLFTNTYYAKINPVKYSARERLINVSKAYGFKEVSSFNLSFALNLEQVSNINPFVVQVAINDKQLDEIYSVYRLDDDGSVYKCRSSQTANYIQFLTDDDGDFMILAMDSQNVYDLADGNENISVLNHDIDIHGIFLLYSTGLCELLILLILIINIRRLKNQKEILWNDYKKLSLNAASVHAVKPKN